MLPASTLRVLDAARAAADDVNRLIDDLGLPNPAQLREAVESIAANIREGFGRNPGRERNQFLRFARGSAEEADERMRAHFVAERLSAKDYWRNHNRLVTTIRMLNALMAAPTKRTSTAETAATTPQRPKHKPHEKPA